MVGVAPSSPSHASKRVGIQRAFRLGFSGDLTFFPSQKLRRTSCVPLPRTRKQLAHFFMMLSLLRPGERRCCTRASLMTPKLVHRPISTPALRQLWRVLVVGCLHIKISPKRHWHQLESQRAPTNVPRQVGNQVRCPLSHETELSQVLAPPTLLSLSTTFKTSTAAVRHSFNEKDCARLSDIKNSACVVPP